MKFVNSNGNNKYLNLFVAHVTFLTCSIIVPVSEPEVIVLDDDESYDPSEMYSPSKPKFSGKYFGL